MTPEVLKKRTDDLNKRLKNAGYGWIDGKYTKPPHPEYMETLELQCVDDINSVLTYNFEDDMTANDILTLQDGNEYDFLSDYKDILGRDYVLYLIENQIADIDHIERGIWDYTCSYNKIVWKPKN